MSSRWSRARAWDGRNLPREKQLRLYAFLGVLGAAIVMVERGAIHGWVDPMIALAVVGVPVLLVGIFAPQIVTAWRRHMHGVYGDDGRPTRNRRK